MHLPPYFLHEHTDPLWRRLAGARLFITGGTGLFGQWLLQSLEDANQRLGLDISVLLLSRDPNAFASVWVGRHTRLDFLQGDVRLFRARTDQFDYVLHMASTSAVETFQNANQLEKFDLLYAGTRRVIDYAIACGAKRMLFTSSGAAYGQTPTAPVSETELSRVESLAPESALGLGKLAAEFLCVRTADAGHLQTVIARCFAFVGPGLPLDVHYAIGNFMRDALAGQEIVIRGDGSPVRSYMFMADLVVWLLKILLDGRAGDIYNVGSDEAVTLAELARRVAKESASGARVHVLGNAAYQVGVPVRNVYVPSITKAREALDLHIWTSLDQAVQLTLRHLRDDGRREEFTKKTNTKHS